MEVILNTGKMSTLGECMRFTTCTLTLAAVQAPIKPLRDALHPPILMVLRMPSLQPGAVTAPCRADWKDPGKSSDSKQPNKTIVRCNVLIIK